MIRKSIATVAAVLFLLTAGAEAQRRTTKKPPPPAPPKTEAAKVQCRESLGAGVRTQASYCFVLAGRDPAEGVLVTIPSHTGPARLTFDLHNRHTYSEEDVKSGRGFATYTAVIGVLTMKGDLLGRGAVRSEFRKAADLFERIGGGAGPGGVKAVAPIGNETVIVEIPAGVTQVSLLGEMLEALTSIGRESASPGRPVAIVSNVRVEYRPGK
ncbi:MAG TPA: hypothetical protein VM493_09260 [Vicinamibacterales bacterium]|nr:hypothetical protein [Vicinamibacterales bacterium]